MRGRVLALVAGVGVVGIAATFAWGVRSDDAAPDPTTVAAPEEAVGMDSFIFDEATSVEVDRDAFTVTERDSTGLMRATVSQQVSSVLREGDWVPISTELSLIEDGVIAAIDHPLEPAFAPSADASGLVHVQNAGYSLSMSIEGADSVEATEVAASADVADGTAVNYEGAIDGSDLVFEVGQQAIYPKVILRSVPEAQPTYVWVLEAPGLRVEQPDEGGMHFVGPDGDVIFDVPDPSMWDSAGGDGGMAESASTSVDYVLTALDEGRWALELQPDLTWLSDPALTYPVSIDPNVYPGSGMVATYKENNFTYNYASVPRIGNTKENSTCCSWRTVLRYPMNAYFGKRVTGAALVADWTYGTTTNQAASVWWATAFRFDGNGAKIADFAIARQGVAYGGVFDMVASILNNSDQYSYLMLVGEENNGIYSRKDLSTYVTFTYVDPAVVTGVTGTTPTSPVAGPLTQVYVDDLVMQATGVNYTPGTTQLFRYDFKSSDGGAAWLSPWVAPGPYRVPATALTPGKSYWYTIASMDTGTASPVKTMGNVNWMLHTKSAPNVPTNVTVDNQALSGTVTANARPVLAAAVSDPDGVAGGQVWALFTVRQGGPNGIVIMDSVPGSKVQGSGISILTLPYAISADGDYTVEVRAFDGHLAGDPVIPPGQFEGPVRTLRELPTTGDDATDAVS